MRRKIVGKVIGYSNVKEINSYLCGPSVICDFDSDMEYDVHRRIYHEDKYSDHFYSYESLIVEYVFEGEVKKLIVPKMYHYNYLKPGDSINLKRKLFSKIIEPCNFI